MYGLNPKRHMQKNGKASQQNENRRHPYLWSRGYINAFKKKAPPPKKTGTFGRGCANRKNYFTA